MNVEDVDACPAREAEPLSIAEPRLSIVTVVLDDPAGLEATVRSVAEQTFRDFEYIVIDGGSGPPTQEVLGRFREVITTLVSEPDEGLYHAMNKGLDRARGAWIQFLNAGDTFLSPQALGAFMVEARLEADVLFGDHVACYPGWRRPMRAADPGVLPYGGFACHQALLVRTGLARRIGGFREDRWPAADYDFACRLMALGPSHQHIPQDLVAYQCGGLSEIHAVRSRLQEWRISREHFGPSLGRDLSFLLRLGSALVNATLRKLGLAGVTNTLRRLRRGKSRPLAAGVQLP